MNIKYKQFFMKSAMLTSKLSKCKRKKVGAVLVKDKRILANGYNGTLAGMQPDICEEWKWLCHNCKTNVNDIMDKDLLDYRCPNCGEILKICFEESCEIKADLEINEEKTSEFTLHAEQNIITFCSKNGIPTNNTQLFVTLSPCKTCAKLLVQAGIKEVYYLEEYRDTSGIDYLKKFIYVEQVDVKNANSVRNKNE